MTLSTSLTFIYKYIVPAIFLWIIVGVTIEIGFVFILAAIPFSVYGYFFIGKLKKVEWNETGITISNFIKRITVPIEQIESVRYGNTFYNPWLVYIKFKEEAAFGKEIVFWRKYKLSTVSIINELKGAKGSHLKNVRGRETVI